ncbi:precorrin-2 dehydrogenase/sirohydrochlorin ferrochelatase family protein [Brucella haematophila]|uniref:precorrin-2 dehydrogenase/sirohydrochlorin ferrochelatase family protein n=1 Tax=Brucella haematophila TaxID=419474 RepID=UPI00110F06C6|nr:NAD(P)-dependent oxidoreductase [Brucella haematophila]TMV04388.1 siroheme synthase [Brucella haematophila]
MGVSQPQPSEAFTRIEPLAKLPVFWALEGRRCIVSGGSDAAAWKAELLAACGARVEVYTDAPDDMMHALAVRPVVHAEACITLIFRPLQDADLPGAAMAIADCHDEGEAAALLAACNRAGVPVNVIDKPQYCQFQFGSIVNRSPVIVAISTDGGAPVLAQTIRRKIEALLPASLKDWALLAQNLRTRIGSMVTTATARRHFWDIFADKAFSEPCTRNSETDLLAVASHEVSDAGSVKVFTVNPADPELMTLKAIRALQAADIIYFNKDIVPAILEFGRREAKRYQIEDISSQISKLDQCRIVYLKSGKNSSGTPFR